jgi:hypothetical protein
LFLPYTGRGLDGFRSMGAGAHGFRLGRDLEPKLVVARTAEFSKTGHLVAGGDSAREGTRNIAVALAYAYGVRKRLNRRFPTCTTAPSKLLVGTSRRST